MDKTDPSGKTCTEGVGLTYQCQVDTYVNWRGKEIPRSKMTKSQLRHVSKFEAAYAAAVNRLMSDPTKAHTITIKETGKSETVTAGDVGHALIDREMVANSSKTSAMGTAGSTTYIGPVGLSGEGEIAGVTPKSSERLMEVEITHEGLHGSDVDIDAKLQGKITMEAWNGDQDHPGIHQAPYELAADDLLGPE